MTDTDLPTSPVPIADILRFAAAVARRVAERRDEEERAEVAERWDGGE